MPTNDRRLIEDYIPIEAISAEARREKSIRKGHISTLHLWWARRPLVAARAAVYGALVPAPEGRKAEKEAARSSLMAPALLYRALELQQARHAQRKGCLGVAAHTGLGRRIQQIAFDPGALGLGVGDE